VIGNVAFFVERLLETEALIDGPLHLMLIAGAGTTIATCSGQPSREISSWSGLISTALKEIGSIGRVGAPTERAKLREAAEHCKTTRDTEELLNLCDLVRTTYARADLDLSQWIFDKLEALGKELEARIKSDETSAALLCQIRDWQTSFGAIVATTNYDRLLSIANCGKPIELFEDPLRSDPSRALTHVLDGAHNVIHLHGRYDRDGSAVFSRDQYKRLIEHNLEPGCFVKVLFDATLPIFVGCGAGLADEDIRALIADRSGGPEERMKRSIVLYREGDAGLPDLKTPPFDKRCVGISYGTEYSDLVPFLDQVRRDLIARGFRGRRGRKGAILAERWLAWRRDARASAGVDVPIPPMKLDREIRDVRLRRFYGTLLQPRAPNYEFQAVDYAIASPESRDALYDDARFDPVPLSRLDDTTLAVILGDGGSGKTSLTHVLMSRALERESELVAVHVRIADYYRACERRRDGREDGAADLWDFIVRDLRRTPVGVTVAPPPYDDLDEALQAASEEGRILILLDGLDEVSRLSDRGPIVAEAIALHDRLQSAAARLSSTRRNRLVLTSRFSGYRTAPVMHPRAQHFALCPLAPEQVSRLHDAFFAELIAEGAGDRASLRARRRKLRCQLKPGSHSAVAWIDTPLMAMLVAVVFLSDGTLPATKEALYRRLVEQGCCFVIDRAPALPRPLTACELRRGLERAASRIFSKSSQDALSRTALRDAFWYLRPNESVEDIDALITVATSDQSLLRERGPGYFAFVHRGILEFLCGSHMQDEVGQLAVRAREPEWKEPASFAMAMALQGPNIAALASAIASASSVVNGARPLCCLLRGALYAIDLSPASRCILATTTIAVLAKLSAHIASIEEHRSLRALLSALGSQKRLADDFEAAAKACLNDSQAPSGSRMGALLVCEGLSSGSAELVKTIDMALADGAGPEVLLGERVQRGLIRRRAGATPPDETPALLPFGEVMSTIRLTMDARRLAEWRRSISALCGGIDDLGYAHLHQIYLDLVKLLAAPDSRRNLLLFTLAEQLRTIAMDQQNAVAKYAMKGPGRALSERETLRELRRRPDLVMGIALYLDEVVAPALKASNPTIFDPKLFYRTPSLANEIVGALKAAQPADKFARDPAIRALGPMECAVVDAVLGNDVDPQAAQMLKLAQARLADGAVRSLLAVEGALSSKGGVELVDLGLILSDAVLDLKLHLQLPAKFDVGKDTGREEYSQRNFEESLARSLTGADLTQDDVYNTMVIVDVLDARKRVGGLLELGHSRTVASGRSTWDWPPLPLPHLHNDSTCILGEAFDILEICPSSISGFRSNTLKGLREIPDPATQDSKLEIDAVLARDWGAQAPFDEEQRLSDPDWGDRALGALDAARAAKPSIWTARALIRLLHFASAGEMEQREAEILAQIALLDDPFEQVLALELLADRAAPVRGQSYALKAFERLWSAAAYPKPMLRRRVHPSFSDPERCARAYARLSVWLPLKQRRRALLAAAGFAAIFDLPWRRTRLLKVLAPYTRRMKPAWALWKRAVSRLPSHHQSFCEDATGEVLRDLVDGFLYDADGLSGGEADSIVAYAMLRSSLRRLGHCLEPWEALERAEISPAGAEAVKRAFQAETVPRVSAAGLLSLREFCEAGMSEVASFVLSRAPRHPPGTAALLHDSAPALAELVRAVNHGIDACSAVAVVDALSGADESRRTLAVTTLEPPPPVETGNKKELLEKTAFTLRRASAEGIETMLALANAATHRGRGARYVQHVSWYVNTVLMETRAQAERLVETARQGEDMQAARWLLKAVSRTTPQFLRALFEAVDPQESLAAVCLPLLARALSRAPILMDRLGANGTLDIAWHWVSSRPDLARTIHRADAERVAQFFLGGTLLEPGEMDAEFEVKFACELAQRDDFGPALLDWGAAFFVRDRPEGEASQQAASAIIAQDERAIAALVGFCAWDARELVLTQTNSGLGLRGWAWPLLAACTERCPVSLQSKMLAAAMFEALPEVASEANSWVTRRSAFQLMPLEWRTRPARTSLDVLQAVLGASEDIWQVQEAALGMVGTINMTDIGALDMLYAAADRGGTKALMAFRIINAILNNDRAAPHVRRHAQQLVERALESSLGDRLIEHGVSTANAPPRMRLRDVLLQQACGDS
jgi:hypothetical protein